MVVIVRKRLERLFVSDEACLEQILETMLHANEDITFRNASRHSNGHFPFPTSLTRRPGLRSLVERYVARQTEARRLAGKIAKSSPAKTAARLVAAEVRISELSRQNALLVAGLRGAILAIGRTGGIRAWKEYFPAYSAAFAELRSLGAVPENDVVEFAASKDHSQAPPG
jgi:hypothetical protein